MLQLFDASNNVTHGEWITVYAYHYKKSDSIICQNLNCTVGAVICMHQFMRIIAGTKEKLHGVKIDLCFNHTKLTVKGIKRTCNANQNWQLQVDISIKLILLTSDVRT